MGIFNKKPDTPAEVSENRGRRSLDREPLKRIDGSLHADLAARGQEYIDQVRTRELDDQGWSPKIKK